MTVTRRVIVTAAVAVIFVGLSALPAGAGWTANHNETVLRATC